MATRPWFPLYVGDFLSDPKVMAMDAECVGAYFLALCACWKDGFVPDNDERLQMLCKCSANGSANVLQRVRDCLQPAPENPGFLHSPRMTEERIKAQGISNIRRDAALQRKDRRAAKAQQKHTQSQSQSQPISPSSTPSGSPRVAASKPKAKAPRKKPTGDHHAFIEWWGSEFRKATGEDYAFEGAKDAAHVKAILKLGKGDHDLIKKRALAILDSDDPFYAEKGVNLGLLKSQWNRLASGGRGNGHDKNSKHYKNMTVLKNAAERLGVLDGK